MWPRQALHTRNISAVALQPINQALQQPWNEPYAAQPEHGEKTMVLYTPELQISFPGIHTPSTWTQNSMKRRVAQVTKSNAGFGEGDYKCGGGGFVRGNASI